MIVRYGPMSSLSTSRRDRGGKVVRSLAQNAPTSRGTSVKTQSVLRQGDDSQTRGGIYTGWPNLRSRRPAMK